MILAALGINLILGVLYAWGVMGKALAGQWHWSKADAALPMTASTVCFAVMMTFAGRCQDKIGPRWVAMLGGLMLGAGLIASAFVTTPHGLMLTFGLVGGLGIGLGYSATTPPAIKWFPSARKGLITGIVVSGVGLAAVYMAPLTAKLLAAFDPSKNIASTFMALGIGTIILVSLLAQLLANPPAGYSPVPAAASAGHSSRPAAARREMDWPEMLRTPQFYQLWLMFIMAAAAGLMMIMHLSIIAKEQAHVDAWGFWLIAIVALCNTLGRLLGGALSDRIGRTRTMVLVFVLQGLNMLAFSHYTTRELMIFGAAFTGLCYGPLFTLFPATTAELYGVRNLGVNYGLMFTAFGVAGVTGPYLLGGQMRDHSGSYNSSFLVSAMLLFGAAVLALTVKTAQSAPTPPPPHGSKEDRLVTARAD